MKILSTTILLLFELFAYCQSDTTISVVKMEKDMYATLGHADSLGSYVNGKFVGTVNYHDTKGKILYGIEFTADSSSVSKQYHYYPNGQLSWVGDKHTSKAYFKNGNLWAERTESSSVVYFKNGSVKEECEERETRSKRTKLMDCVTYKRNGEVEKKFRRSSAK